MKLLLSVILGVLALVQAGNPDPSGPAEHLVSKLPEMPYTGYNMYSGYINIKDTTKQLHYLLTESQNDWKTDPLIIWFNGGPGCSSMLAFATENGPFQLKAGQTTFQENEFSWNKKASVLYIEQPAGVGYSYCNGTAAPEDCKFSDTTQSYDTLKFVVAWMEEYSNYKGKDLYISGESYGGIYVPYLAYQLAHNSTINVSGFMVGNGVTNWKYDTTPATIQTAYHHAMYSDQLHEEILASGCNWTLSNFDSTRECANLQQKMFGTWNTYFNFYNMFQREDGTGLFADEPQNMESDVCVNAIDRPELRAPHKKIGLEYTPWLKTGVPTKKACLGGTALSAYFNSAAVREALHITNDQPWNFCGPPDPEWQYTLEIKASQWIWEDLALNFPKLRMLKFSGDQDGAVPTTGSIEWINTLGWDDVKAWAPWMDVIEGQTPVQVGGYIWRLKGMDFVTVQSAGHMVPEDQPARGYKVIFDWINQEGIWATTPTPPSEDAQFIQ